MDLDAASDTSLRVPRRDEVEGEMEVKGPERR